MPPNVLCVVLDTARADFLEPYGASGSAPTVAQLADSGVALRQAYATACWTLPSHASMLTGLLPRAAGLAVPQPDGAGARTALRALANRLLPAVLRANGYRTSAASANVWISKTYGFDTGFDEFVTVDSGRQSRIHVEGARARLHWAGEGVRARVDDGATAIASVLRGWIESTDQRPWFWFVNLVECHSPYLPPRPYNDLGPIGRLLAADEARRHLTLSAIWKACLADFDVPGGALARMRRLYARSIRYMDDWLAEVLERLDARGMLDETLVLVLSDHGENFGEGGLLGHAFSLDDRLIRVPLIAAGPGAAAFEDRLTSLAGLPQLVAQAIGLDEHPWAEGSLPEGAAVAQFDPPAGVDDPRIEEVSRAWELDDAALHRLTTPFVAATDGRLKLLREGAAERTYDLGSDPHELAPVFPSDGDDVALAALRAALEHPAATAQALPGEPLRDRTGAEPPDPDEVAEIEERMKLLGYM